MVDTTRYAAGIVLYNPELNRLKRNVEAVASQVQNVYCFNNGLKEDEQTKELLASYDNVILIGTGENLGIATALNKLVDRANRDGMEWILTLDQDSVVSDNMIEEMSMSTKYPNVAIVCPLIEDIRRKNEKSVCSSTIIEDVDFCITSGSFMNIQKILAVGGFDDFLFIGLVDNEICYRIKLKGYKILRNNAVVLNHELGNLTPSKHEKMWLKLGDVLHNKTIKKLSYQRNVNPMRLYYATRNMIYLNVKYSGEYVDAWSKKKIFFNAIFSFLRGQKKWQLLQAIIAGILSGFKSIKILKCI